MKMEERERTRKAGKNCNGRVGRKGGDNGKPIMEKTLST